MVKLLALLVLLALSISLAWPQIFLLTRRKRDGTAIPNNCDSVNDANLQAYWRLDEASGNATDTKGANTLTDNGGVGTTTGKISGARTFNGSMNQYLSRADNAALSTGAAVDFTIACWVDFTSVLGAGQYPAIVGKWPGGGNNEYLLFLNGDNSRFVFTVSNDGTAETSITANNFGAPSFDVWYFVVAWHDSENNTLNIQVDNGTVDSVGYASDVRDGTGEFQVGAFNASAFWTGNLDELLFAKRVLTSGERSALYNSGNGCRPTGL